MDFYDYFNFITDVVKAKFNLDKDFYVARMSLVALQDRLNYELAARI